MTAGNAIRVACQQYDIVDGYRQDHASTLVCINICILACSCRYTSTMSFCGQAAQLHDGVRLGVLIDLLLQLAVRSEAYFKGRLEHQRYPKLPKKRTGSKQDGQKGAPGVGRTAQKAPRRAKGRTQRAQRESREQAGWPKGKPGGRQNS